MTLETIIRRLEGLEGVDGVNGDVMLDRCLHIVRDELSKPAEQPVHLTAQQLYDQWMGQATNEAESVCALAHRCFEAGRTMNNIEPTKEQLYFLGKALYETEPLYLKEVPWPWENLEPETQAKCITMATGVITAWLRMNK